MMRLTLRLVRAAVIFELAIPPAHAQLSGGGVLPSENEIRGVQNLCGGGTAQFASVSGQVNAALSNWKQGVAGANVEIAKKNLAGVLGQVKNDANLAPVFKVYVECINDSLQKFLDREKKKPIAVTRSGNSGALLRSAFATNEEMKAAGCGDAESDAVRKLKQVCGERTFVQMSEPDCDQQSGSPRTYIANVHGECRTQH